jgi:antitoxin ParD1/3/4
MSKNTSISLGNYFDEFIKSRINAGRYKNASEMIRAGLRSGGTLETQSYIILP